MTKSKMAKAIVDALFPKLEGDTKRKQNEYERLMKRKKVNLEALLPLALAVLYQREEGKKCILAISELK